MPICQPQSRTPITINSAETTFISVTGLSTSSTSSYGTSFAVVCYSNGGSSYRGTCNALSIDLSSYAITKIPGGRAGADYELSTATARYLKVVTLSPDEVGVCWADGGTAPEGQGMCRHLQFSGSQQFVVPTGSSDVIFNSVGGTMYIALSPMRGGMGNVKIAAVCGTVMSASNRLQCAKVLFDSSTMVAKVYVKTGAIWNSVSATSKDSAIVCYVSQPRLELCPCMRKWHHLSRHCASRRMRPTAGRGRATH